MKHFGCEADQAQRVVDLVRGKRSPFEYARVNKWVEQCYHKPTLERQRHELTMCALDDELGGYGVEAIRGRHVDNYCYDCQAVYINFGDTYDATILIDHETGKYHLTSWGDWVEQHSEEREIT